MSTDGDASNVEVYDHDTLTAEAMERLKDAQRRSAEWFTQRDEMKPSEDDLVSVTLTASEWLYVQDALTRASTDLVRKVRRLAWQYTIEGMPMDFDIRDMAMHYVEAIRFRRFYMRITETLIGRRKAENDGE